MRYKHYNIFGNIVHYSVFNNKSGVAFLEVDTSVVFDKRTIYNTVFGNGNAIKERTITEHHRAVSSYINFFVYSKRFQLFATEEYQIFKVKLILNFSVTGYANSLERCTVSKCAVLNSQCVFAVEIVSVNIYRGKVCAVCKRFLFYITVNAYRGYRSTAERSLADICALGRYNEVAQLLAVGKCVRTYAVLR